MADPVDVDSALARTAIAHSTLIDHLSSVTLDPTASSTLEGWSVGHLLNLPARNADDTERRREGSAHRTTVDQHEGGAAARTAGIKAGVSRPQPVLVAAVITTALAITTVASHRESHDFDFLTFPVNVLPRHDMTVLE